MPRSAIAYLPVDCILGELMGYKDLEPIALKHKVFTVKPFDQRAYISSFPFDKDVQDGVCRALSAAFLVRNFSRAASKEDDALVDLDVSVFGDKKFFEAFHHPKLNSPVKQQSQKDKERWDKIATVQKEYMKKDMSEQESIDAARKSVNALSNRMLQYELHATAITYGEGPAVNVKNMPDETGYWLLSAGGHMMAVVIRKGGIITKAKFFDPNAGLATFVDVGNLRSFLDDYLRAANYQHTNLIRFKC